MTEKKPLPTNSTEEQLDAILLVLLSEKLRQQEVEHRNSGYSIEAITEVLELQIDSAQQNYLATLLLNDGHVEPLHEGLGHIIRISHKGVDFISRGGYVQQLKDEEHNRMVEELQLESTRSSIVINRWNKFGIAIGILISLASLIISIIALAASRK